MLRSRYSRFPSRGITLIRTRCHETKLSSGPLGPQFPRYYGAVSSLVTDAPFQRTRNSRIDLQETGRISRTPNRTLTTEATAPAEQFQSPSSSPPNSPTPQQDQTIQTHLRTLMRRVPHPVAIITSTDPASPPETAFRGMTVSSFNTVTLSPSPIVSFNVKFPSETLNAILSSSQFLIHLLSPSDSTATLARLFSGGNENLPLNEDERSFRFSSPHPDFANKQPRVETGEPPVLSLKAPPSNGSVDFPFIFKCEYLPQSISVGDHMIVLGKVTRILTHPDLSSSSSSATVVDKGDLCLTYADTKFWKMGEEISSTSLSGKQK